MSKNFVRAMPCSVIDAATLNPVLFLPIILDFAANPRPTLTEACFLIRIINAANVEVFISFDGVHPNDHVPAGGIITLPFQSNASPSNQVALLAKNSLIYVNGNAGVGVIFVAGYYQEN